MGEGDHASLDEQAPLSALSEDDVLARIPGLRALILRLTRNLDLTNDLVQEAAIAVILAVRARRIHNPVALTAYMHQVARNMVVGQFNRPKLTFVEEIPDTSFWSERPRTPLEHVEASVMRQTALTVLHEMTTDRDREVLTGYYIDGLCKRELMLRMRLTAEQFDRVISRARGRMREKLSAKLNAEAPPVRDSKPTRLLFPGDTKAPR